MAKWQDGVITNAGISLLGEVIAGGEINITRAALGGGTVDEAALMAQTALTLPLTVSPVIAAKKLVEGNGIEIRIQIRNDGLTEDKIMKQVGLFAQLNSGDEVLFAIMQNESGEEIPSEASYKDFMLEFTAALAVSNTGSISVSINKLAVITKEALDDELKSYTSKADFNVHSGNTEIHVTADEKAAWSAVNYSNPNLLINPDFAINQRGETEYTTTGYTVDRWSMQVGFKITPLENGIRICPTGAVTSNLFAIIQNIPVSKAMFGNDYTLTVNVSETNDYAYAVVYAYNSANAVIKPSDKIKLHTGLNSTTIRNIPDNTAYIRVQFTINSGAQTSDTLEILWAKLELGGIATPYTPPDPATELAKCQRYFCKSYLPETAPGTARAYSGEIILNAAGSSKFGQSYIAFPVSMRIIPTVTIFNPDNGESGGICHSGYADTISAAALVPGTNGFNISAVGLTQGDDYYMHYTASAEI